MGKNKFAKYKIINTDITNDIAKKIVGKQVTVEKIKSKGRPTTKSKVKAPAWFIEFEKRNNQRFDRLENRIDKIVRVNNLKE